MNCFRPDPYDYSLKAIPKTFETAKVLLMSLEKGKIELRSRKGALLESMWLTDVQWSPCSVPAGGDHCLSIQYKQPQPREILLSAKSRAAVHHLIRALDRAASKQKNLQIVNPQEVSATSSANTQQKEQVFREQVRDAGTSADIEAHTDKEKEFQQILEQQESHWIRQMETLQREFSLKVSECSDMKKEVEAARSKVKSLESKSLDLEAQLKNSATDIASKMKQLDNVSLECKELTTAFQQTQEEKEVRFLTFSAVQ
jgi:valyl-tRNA synthetase